MKFVYVMDQYCPSLIDDRHKDFRVWNFHVASGRRVLAFTAVAVLRFCTPGLIVSPVARSVLAYRAHRVAISLALRGKARRAPYTGGRRTCMRRLLAVGVTLESTETICNKDDICGRARVGRPPLRRYKSATRDRLEVVREWATVIRRSKLSLQLR